VSFTPRLLYPQEKSPWYAIIIIIIIIRIRRRMNSCVLSY